MACLGNRTISLNCDETRYHTSHAATTVIHMTVGFSRMRGLYYLGVETWLTLISAIVDGYLRPMAVAGC